METEITEIEKDLIIDKDNLDFECLDQPRRFFKWAKKMALQSKEMKRAKRNIAVVRAEVASLVRNEPKLFGLEKVTDAAVVAIIDQHKKVKEAEELFIEVTYEFDIFEAAKWAMTDRKTSIEGLIKLYNEGYFSRVNTDSVGKEALASMADEATQDQKENLKKIMTRRKSL